MKISSTNKYLEKLFNNTFSPNDEIVTIKDGVYENRLFEIKFNIPTNWHLVGVNKYEEINSKQILNGDADKYKKELLDSLYGYTCFITKYHPDTDEHDGIVTPTVAFSILCKDDGYKNTSLEEYAELLDPSNNSFHPLKKFKILEKGNIYQKDHYNHILYKTEYLFEHQEIEKGIMVEMDVLNIDYNDIFLDFSMTQCKVQGEVAQKEFDELIKSITLNRTHD